MITNLEELKNTFKYLSIAAVTSKEMPVKRRVFMYGMSIRIINKCIDLAAYKEGCELAETLSVLEITAKGDYEDFCGEPLGICGPYYYSETFDDELNFARDAYKLLSI